MSIMYVPEITDIESSQEPESSTSQMSDIKISRDSETPDPKRQKTGSSWSEEERVRSLSFASPFSTPSVPSISWQLSGIPPTPFFHSTPGTVQTPMSVHDVASISDDLYASMLREQEQKTKQLIAARAKANEIRQAQEKELKKSTVIYTDETYATQDYDLEEEKTKEGRSKEDYLRICFCKFTYHYERIMETYEVCYRVMNDIKQEKAQKEAGQLREETQENVGDSSAKDDKENKAIGSSSSGVPTE